MRRKDSQHSLADSCRKENGSLLGIQHWCHKFLGTGCGTCCLHTPYHVDSLCSKCTLADNLNMGPQSNLADIHMILPLDVFYRLHSSHMEMEYRDLLDHLLPLVPLLEWSWRKQSNWKHIKICNLCPVSLVKIPFTTHSLTISIFLYHTHAHIF